MPHLPAFHGQNVFRFLLLHRKNRRPHLQPSAFFAAHIHHTGNMLKTQYPICNPILLGPGTDHICSSAFFCFSCHCPHLRGHPLALVVAALAHSADTKLILARLRHLGRKIIMVLVYRTHDAGINAVSDQLDLVVAGGFLRIPGCRARMSAVPAKPGRGRSGVLRKGNGRAVIKL